MAVPGRIDLKKSLDGFRARLGELRLVDLPPSRFLAIDGEGDPNTAPAYRAALGSLYPFSYALKAASRNEFGRDYVVPPLEGLWWADDPAVFAERRDKSLWRWTMMVMVPEWIGGDLVEAARERVRAKGAPDRLDEVRLAVLDEGRCVQTLHIGPYDDEGPVIERMHARALDLGYRLSGRHHEIYLGDARRAAPERLRTILRQPIIPA